ncbi:MAG TPA: single-stranded-DNA-specific exonuclease RecJ [Candidatus Paceibacterota bacterium]|nr:single-stranded-DNA-specific exonuclease RecJ [Candidatus Paceibacterota bacterium]
MSTAAPARDPLIRELLKARGLESEEAIERFLNPSYDDELHDPFLMRGMEAAVERVLAAMEKGERIAVYADFDCDGVPGAAVLLQLFQRLEYDAVESYIPHRHHEGYGLHIPALDTLKERGVSLVITVDLGTTAIEPVAHARALGIDVIVTDHHEPPAELPAALAILNPKFAPYPDPNLCGAATAWKLACAILAKGKERGLSAFASVNEGWEKWLLDLVGIATIADMVPLVGENRVLARYGLMVLRKTPRPGIGALMRELSADQRELTEDDIGFLIGPRINAASRMDEPELALRLLATRHPGEAAGLAKQLEGLNKKRKGVVAAMTREINKRLREREMHGAVTVLGDPEWKPALLGLAANGALETAGGVVCVWGRDGAGNIKGSCRSDGSISVVELFRAADDILTEYGGHHAAGGFSVPHDAIHTLEEEFARRVAALPREELSRAMTAYAVPLARVGQAFYDALAQFAPFGIGNEKPLLAFSNVTIAAIRQFGKAHEHLELTLEQDGARRKAVKFFAKPAEFSLAPSAGGVATILGELERSVFRGSVELRLRLVDIVSPGAPCRATIVSI